MYKTSASVLDINVMNYNAMLKHWIQSDFHSVKSPLSLQCLVSHRTERGEIQDAQDFQVLQAPRHHQAVAFQVVVVAAFQAWVLQMSFLPWMYRKIELRDYWKETLLVRGGLGVQRYDFDSPEWANQWRIVSFRILVFGSTLWLVEDDFDRDCVLF